MFKSGVGFLALFGLGWWLLATGAFGGAVQMVAVGAGCVVAVGLMLAARRILPASAGGPLPADRRRRFNQINGLQWLVIIVIAVVCSRAGAPVLIPPLIALVVGLHFLPLAVVFDQPRLRVLRPPCWWLPVWRAGPCGWRRGRTGPSVSPWA